MHIVSSRRRDRGELAGVHVARQSSADVDDNTRSVSSCSHKGHLNVVYAPIPPTASTKRSSAAVTENALTLHFTEQGFEDGGGPPAVNGSCVNSSFTQLPCPGLTRPGRCS